MLDCKIIQKKLSCYVDCVVDEATLEMIETHLAGCRDCSAELEALDSVRASMLTVAEVNLPAGLSFSIREAIAREEQAVNAECKQVLAMVSEYVDGELVQDAALAVEAHVEACESCAHELAMTRSFVRTAGVVAEIEPPFGLRARIFAATAENVSPLQKLAERVAASLRPVRTGVYAGAAVAAAVVMLTVGRPSNPPAVGLQTASNNTTATKPAAKVHVIEKKTIASADLDVPAVSVKRPRHKRLHTDLSATVAALPARESKSEAKSASHPVAQKVTEKSAPDAKEMVASSNEARKDAETIAAKPAETVPEVVAEATAKDKAVEAAAKPEPRHTEMAARHAIVLPDDDKAMIRSIKQQIRMQRKGEGVSVNIVDSKF